MIRPAPPAAIVSVLMLAVSASTASADPINLLQTGTRSSARVLFDPTKAPWQTDDEAAAEIDEDCVALADRSQARAEFGTVDWTRGRLSWDWEPRTEPLLVYLMCIDRHRAQGEHGGGLEFGAGLSWAGTPMPRQQASSFGRAAVFAGEAPTSFEAGPTPFISWPGSGEDPLEDDPAPSPDDPLDPPTGSDDPGPIVFDIPIAAPTITSSAAPTIGSPDPPALLEPLDLAPVPEPATWILMGTGLAVAWRASRRR